MAEASAEAPKKKILRIKKPSVPAVSATAVSQDLNTKTTAKVPVIRIDSIDDWAQARVKNPAKFGFTPQGDLVGADQSVLEMNPKVAASPEVIQQRLEEKKAKIAEAEANYTVAQRNLQQVIAQYRAQLASAGDVVSANQAVHVADCALALVAKYPRYIQRGGSYMFRDLHLNDFYNVRKFPDPVLEIEYTSFPTGIFWTDKSQEKISLDGSAEEGALAAPLDEEQAKKNAARTGAIIAANRAKTMAGRV
jgi:hypothetical protein